MDDGAHHLARRLRGRGSRGSPEARCFELGGLGGLVVLGQARVVSLCVYIYVYMCVCCVCMGRILWLEWMAYIYQGPTVHTKDRD
jgi:hypothetical protein